MQTKKLKQVQLSELKNKLSAADYELFRRAAVMRCMITNACWSNWMLEKSVPERKYQPIIDEIAGQFGYTVFNTNNVVEEGGEK